MRRGGLLLLFLLASAAAGALSAVVLAATPATRAETTTTTDALTTTPPVTTAAPTTTAPQPTTIRAGVTIARILVGGLSPEQAQAAVRAAFARPITLVAGERQLRVTPRELGAASYLGDAVKRARAAGPGANVPLAVKVDRGAVERYVRRLAKRLDRAPVGSRLLLRRLKPFLTEDVPGRRLEQVVLARRLVLALKTHDRQPVPVPFEKLPAKVTRTSFGDVIVIRRGSNRLFFYNGMELVRAFRVATGQNRYPTPLGRFEIVVKWRNPWWYPPNADWAKGLKPIPPGPGNPLGTRWMGISSPGVGIHGTPDAASIGYSVSHGCIRMYIPEAEWLFQRVEIGTPVFIVAA